MWSRTTLRPLMFFGALAFWAAISFTGKTGDHDLGASPAGVAVSDAADGPEGGAPEAPVRYESTLFPPALRIEAETKVFRLADLSAPRVARVRWGAAARGESGGIGRRVPLIADDRCRAADMSVLARPVQPHSPPAPR